MTEHHAIAVTALLAPKFEHKNLIVPDGKLPLGRPEFSVGRYKRFPRFNIFVNYDKQQGLFPISANQQPLISLNDGFLQLIANSDIETQSIML